MKIWHIGSSPSPQTVDGVNTAVWLTAIEQSALGHHVSLLLDELPNSNTKATAEKSGLTLIYVPSNLWRYDPQILDPLLAQDQPDIVHMHSVFIPKQATLAKRLVQRCIPYAITPHGGLDSQRGQIKKLLYSFLIEKQRFCRAAALTVVTPKEEETIKAFIPQYKGVIRWVPNPIRQPVEKQSWEGNIDTKKLIYLGRFDVLHKGIDILVAIARYLPSDIEIHLYGTKDQKTSRWMQKLNQSLPNNVHFHSPVFGEDKMQVLTKASLYIQVSRWEVFGLSIAEAMYLGVPCAIATTLNFAELFSQHDLGLVLPSNPSAAAASLANVLTQPKQLHHWSTRAKSYAQQNFQARSIALKYLELYEEVIGL